MDRRTFLSAACCAGLTLRTAPAFSARTRPELRIGRIVVQSARGRRLTPVARNAYADYRGFDVAEPILRVQTGNGLEGIGRAPALPPGLLRQLLGHDAAAMFVWKRDRIVGPAPAYEPLLRQAGGLDIALIDLCARAMRRPVADLLGKRVRKDVPIYESSVYMEDLLTDAQLVDIAYLRGKPPPADRTLLPALKAEWVLASRPEGFGALKIKLGRSRWMPVLADARQRDIDVTHAVRRAIGPDITLMVDGNKDYAPDPGRAIRYASAVRADRVHMLEEMFPEGQIDDLKALRHALHVSGDPVRLACGESHRGGIAAEIYSQPAAPSGRGPLIDIEQADMNANGFLYLREKAAAQRALGMTMAPHNFGSKMGFYAMTHLAAVTPNWESSEVDDAVYPALRPEGIEVTRGSARLTGASGLGVALREEHLDKPQIDLN